jgi:DNA-binding beta-propeller fold protein YncE
VSVINGRTGTVVAAIHVGLIPVAVAVNPRTDTAYVANADDSTVSVIAPCRP